MNQAKLFFIRHGESLKNEAAHAYQKQKNIPFNWEIFIQDPEFLKRVTYNLMYIDCHLSEKGKLECHKAREEYKGFEPDIILVSPLQRALETCSIIFGGRNIPVIVEPLLSETFKHSSDICKSIQVKKHEFGDYDFSKVDAEGQFWYIKNDSWENQQKYFNFLKEVDHETYQQKSHRIMQLMKRQNMCESAMNVRQRAQKMKSILKQYAQNYKRIAVVSHFYTIRFMCCTEFDQNNEPLDHICMKNCGILETTLQQILDTQ